MNEFQNNNCATITYDVVYKANGDKQFTLSLTDREEYMAVLAAVKQGIDSHLEACFIPDRGDKYEWGERKAGKSVLCRTLECSISPESLPVLIRRLFESGDEAGEDEEHAGRL